MAEDHLNRLADKFTKVNEKVARAQRLKELRARLDRMVLDGKLGYNPETDEYVRLSEHDGLFGSVDEG